MTNGDRAITILAVDDDEDVLTALSAVIEDRMPGANLLTAGDGASGLFLAVDRVPDVILLDIVLPGLSGYTVCEKLKAEERTKDVPVVFMTAHQTDRRSRVRALESGGEGFLIKPFDESELLAQIRVMGKIREAHVRAKSENDRLEALVSDRTRRLVEELENRSQIERNLRESERRYRVLVENSRELLFALDEQGCLVFVSASVSAILGYPADHMKGSPFDSLIHSDDLARLRELFRQSQNEGYQSSGTEFRLRHASGAWKWMVTRGSWVKPEGGGGATFNGIASDITERKLAELKAQASDAEARSALVRANQSRQALLSMVEDVRASRSELQTNETRLRTALRAAKQGLWDLNVQTGDAWVSPEYATMLGYEADGFAETNEAWIERLHPEERDLVGESYRRYIRGEVPEYRVEFRQRCKDGTWKWILSIGEIVERAADGTPLRMLGSHTDIDVNKRLEQSLRESTSQLRTLARKLQDVREEERRELALEIHDELGQMLTAVKMDIGLIERILGSWGETYVRSPLPERVASLRTMADVAIGATRQLMTRLRPEVLDRLGFAAAIEWLVESWTKRYQIPCTVTIDQEFHDLPDPIAITLFRVTQEGLTNIARHARARAASIVLSRKGAGISYEIADDGIGIAAHVQRSDRYGLLGIRERVEALGGEFHTGAGPDGGTVLRVDLSSDVADQAALLSLTSRAGKDRGTARESGRSVSSFQ